MSDRSSPVVRRHAGAALALSVMLLLAACGAGLPRTAPPSGIDGLEIPTPRADPADFGARVDNPWFPLAPGSEWTYRSGDGRSRVVTVPAATREVGGVEATVVQTVERSPRGPVATTAAWYAQDLDGNVWHLGDEGSWRAGAAGARAGLVMPATPRVGDGFVQAEAPGVVQDESRVLAVDARRATPYASFDSLVHLERASPLEPGGTAQVYFARGVGPVLEERGSSTWWLVGFSAG